MGNDSAGAATAKPGDTTQTDDAAAKAAAEKTAAEEKAAADAKAATEKAAADKAAADKKATDDAAAAAAAAGKDGKASADGKDGQAAGVPEKYTLTLPQDGPFAEPDLDTFATEAKALGLTNDQAQRMVDARVALVAKASAQFKDQVKADPELGGDHFTETEALARKGRDYLFPEGTADRDVVIGWFERTGLGNHPALVRAFARLGKVMAEDSPSRGALGGGAGTKPKRDPEDVLYGKK